MNIAIEDLDACRKRLKIEVPAKRVNEEFERVTTAFRDQARIPGFRVGKAPKSVIQKRFAKEIEEELKRTLLQSTLREAVRERNLKVVTSPLIEDLNYQPGVTFSYSTLVELAPEFPLPDYKELKVPVQDTAVLPEEIEGVIQQIRQQHADYPDVVGRPAAEGDMVVINYEATVDGKPMSEVIPDSAHLASRDGFWLKLSPDAFLPGLGQALVGCVVEDQRQVEVTFPQDFPHEPARGKTAVYQVKVTGVKTIELPEFNDQLAAEALKMPNAEAARAAIEQNLKIEKEQQERSRRIREIINQLKSKVAIDLPPTVLRNETQRVIRDIVQENQARGIPAELIQEKKADIFSAASESAADRVKVNLILDKIAEAEKITVTQEEVAKEISMLSIRYSIPLKQLIQRLRKADAIHEIEETIRHRKTIDLLLQLSAKS